MTDAIPPIPELYWDGIQFYLPAENDLGDRGYSVMYLHDGNWAYQGWTAAPSEDCPVVRVVTDPAGPEPVFWQAIRDGYSYEIARARQALATPGESP